MPRTRLEISDEERKERILESKRKSYHAHKEARKEYGQKYYDAHRDAIHEKVRKWQQDNRDYYNQLANLAYYNRQIKRLEAAKAHTTAENNFSVEKSSAMSPPVGKHCMFYVSEIPMHVPLSLLPPLERRMKDIAIACQLNVVAECGHQFQPEGASMVLLLSESHMSIHTYPEWSACYIDIFSCNVNFDHEHALRVIKETFSTEQVDLRFMVR